MQTLRITEHHEEAVAHSALLLAEGNILLIPTDTVYGLAVDAFNPEALTALFAAKARNPAKGFPLFVSSIEMARRIAYVDRKKEEFLKKVWPGLVTVVLHAKDTIPKTAIGGGATVALRMPDHRFVLDVIEKLGRPITGTSANISGKAPVRSADEAALQWEHAETRPTLLCDAGVLPERPPSVIVDITGSHPIIVRAGVMTKGELDHMLALAR